MKISDKIKELVTFAGPRAYSKEELESEQKTVSVTIFPFYDCFQVSIDKWNMNTDNGIPEHEGTLVDSYDTESYTLLGSLNQAMEMVAGKPVVPSREIIVKDGKKYLLVEVK